MLMGSLNNSMDLSSGLCFQRLESGEFFSMGSLVIPYNISIIVNTFLDSITFVRRLLEDICYTFWRSPTRGGTAVVVAVAARVTAASPCGGGL